MREPEEITQADREAAAEILIDSYDYASAAEQVRKGQWDDHPLVQAFARHRITAQREAIEEAAETGAAAVERWCEGIDGFWAREDIVEDVPGVVRSAIRSLPKRVEREDRQ